MAETIQVISNEGNPDRARMHYTTEDGERKHVDVDLSRDPVTLPEDLRVGGGVRIEYLDGRPDAEDEAEDETPERLLRPGEAWEFIKANLAATPPKSGPSGWVPAESEQWRVDREDALAVVYTALRKLHVAVCNVSEVCGIEFDDAVTVVVSRALELTEDEWNGHTRQVADTLKRSGVLTEDPGDHGPET